MKLFSFLSFIFLTNCISLLPPPVPAAQKVDLQIQSHNFSNLELASWSLIIEQPMALDPYISSKVMLNIEENGLNRLQPCADLEWSDRLPLLIQQKLAQAFERSQKIASVGLSQENFSADCILQINIQKAEIKLKDLVETQKLNQNLDTIQVDLKVSAKLINQKTLKIIAQKSFDYQISCHEKTKKAFISGFEKAWSDFIYDLVKWTLVTDKMKIMSIEN